MNEYEELLERAKESPVLFYPALAGTIRTLLRERDELRALVKIACNWAQEYEGVLYGRRHCCGSSDLGDHKSNCRFMAVLAGGEK